MQLTLIVFEARAHCWFLVNLLSLRAFSAKLLPSWVTPYIYINFWGSISPVAGLPAVLFAEQHVLQPVRIPLDGSHSSQLCISSNKVELFY